MKWSLIVFVCLAIANCVYSLSDDELVPIQLSFDMMNSHEFSTPTRELFDDLKQKMTALYYVCQSDSVCSRRFYIESNVTQGNDIARRLQVADESTQLKKFFRVLVFWAQQDDSPLSANQLRDRIILSDYDPADDVWWLTMMNSGKPICNDNQEWEIGQGCIVRFDRLNDAGNPIKPRTKIATSNHGVEFLTVLVLSLIIISVIVGSMLMIRSSFSELMKSINTAVGMSNGIVPGPPQNVPIDRRIDSELQSTFNSHHVAGLFHHHLSH